MLQNTKDLSTAVIGFGLGVSAGALGKLKDVKDVSVLEISKEVIKGVKKTTGTFNFNVFSNPKVDIMATDGFRYFARHKKKFDIIVSSPSNTWLVGVENLFSKEFYQIAKSSLNQGGVLVQWFHSYTLNEDTLNTVFQTISKEFSHVEVYQTGNRYLAFVLSNEPLRLSYQRFNEPFLKPFHKAFGINKVEDLTLAKILDMESFNKSILFNDRGIHSIHTPKLIYKADKDFFLNKSINVSKSVSDLIAPHQKIVEQKIKALKKFPDDKEKIFKFCIEHGGFNFFCSKVARLKERLKAFNNQELSLENRFLNYVFLRKEGFIRHNPQFLDQVKEDILTKEIESTLFVGAYIDNLLSVYQWEQAYNDLSLFKDRGIINETTYQALKKTINDISETFKKF